MKIKRTFLLLWGILIVPFFLTVSAVSAQDTPYEGLMHAMATGFVTELNLRADAEPINLSDTLEAAKFLPQQDVVKTDMRESYFTSTLSLTVVLDWYYQEGSLFVASFALDGLPKGASFALPKLTYDKIYTYEMVFPDNVFTYQTADHLYYYSYQVANPVNEDRKIDIAIDLPLLLENSAAEDPGFVFHYDLKNVVVQQGMGPHGLQQSGRYSFNGTEVQMRSLRMTANSAAAFVCYDIPTDQPADWAVSAAELEIIDGKKIALQDVVLMDDPQQLNDQCAMLHFPDGGQQGERLVLRILSFQSKSDSAAELNGPWEFYTMIPNAILFPEPEPKAQGTEEIDPGKVHITLNWGYADAHQLAFGYTIHGLPYTPEAGTLAGLVDITDANGEPVPSSGFSRNGWTQGESGTIRGTWSGSLEQPGTPPFKIVITLDGSYKFGTDGPFPVGIFEEVFYADGDRVQVPNSAVGSFTFDVDLPVYPAEKFVFNQSAEAKGIQIRLIEGEFTPTQSSLILCYTKPTQANWIFENKPDSKTLLTAGDFSTMMSSGSMIYDADFGGWIQKWNLNSQAEPPALEKECCININFNLGKTADAQPMTLTIPRLEQSQPEMIPTERIQAVRTALKEKGIEMNYTSGDGFSRIDFPVMPEGMTWEEAYELFNREMGYIVDGPWTISFDVP